MGEHLLIETRIKRVPSRFFGIREFLYFNRGIRDFKGKSGRDSGLKVSRMVGCKKNYRDCGIVRNLGSGLRD